jgi:hypothetical protein
MPICIAPPTLELEDVRGIEVDVELIADNDRTEPLDLWDETSQELQQFTDAALRLLCFPTWQPTEASPVQDGQPVILSYGLGADSTALLRYVGRRKPNEMPGLRKSLPCQPCRERLSKSSTTLDTTAYQR